MATYVTKKCPHCNYSYQIHQLGDQRRYGCPYQTCFHCKEKYWDTDIKEPALYGYENFHETKESILQIITLAIYAPLGLAVLCLGIFLLINGEMLGIFLLIMGGFIAYAIVSYFKQLICDANHKNNIIANRQKDYDASLARLQDITYLTQLSAHDSRAKRLLNERTNNYVEHYAQRPQ